MHIQEVILQTASITRTRQFYTRTLGLPLVAESAESITFRAGNTLLLFQQVQDSKPFYHIAFNITNNKFSDSYEWINSKLDILEAGHGLPIANYPAWNAESFYFHDNNGNILEFIARFDLPYYSPEPFDIKDIREISEVGIVTKVVAATAAMLHAKYDIPYFSKSKPSEHFTVLGDDSGLLIITTVGRGWVPTLRPAQIYPLTIAADGQKIEL
jgi:catechol 2,3-dioxygenase-like lactoylglutathione lyase family enzyme